MPCPNPTAVPMLGCCGTIRPPRTFKGVNLSCAKYGYGTLIHPTNPLLRYNPCRLFRTTVIDFAVTCFDGSQFNLLQTVNVDVDTGVEQVILSGNATPLQVTFFSMCPFDSFLVRKVSETETSLVQEIVNNDPPTFAVRGHYNYSVSNEYDFPPDYLFADLAAIPFGPDFGTTIRIDCHGATLAPTGVAPAGAATRTLVEEAGGGINWPVRPGTSEMVYPGLRKAVLFSLTKGLFFNNSLACRVNVLGANRTCVATNIGPPSDNDQNGVLAFPPSGATPGPLGPMCLQNAATQVIEWNIDAPNITPCCLT